MDIKELQENIRERYSGVDIYLLENKKYIFIDVIVIPNDKRCLGIGTDIMHMIIKFSKEINKPIAILPAIDYGASSIERLKDFYRRFGFVENKILRDKRFRIKYMVKLL